MRSIKCLCGVAIAQQLVIMANIYVATFSSSKVKKVVVIGKKNIT